MLNRKSLLMLMLIALLVLPGAAFAQQGGGSRPAPSGSGGTMGSPGMGGAALNTGTQGGGRSAGGGGQMGGGGQAGGSGERPQIGGGQGGQGGGAGGQFGAALEGRPTPGAGRAGGGFAAFGEGGEGGVAARFGERGSGNLQLELPTFGEGTAPWAERFGSGGFGARAFGAQGEETPRPQRDEESAWHPENAPEGMPEAPAALDDFEGAADAAENAQAAVEEAVASGTEQAQAAANAATEAAQQAYDQLWADYYAAVDYTAQAYYDTVTATADYMLQSYYAAVDYTTQAVDYYIDYYDQYAYYCTLYPWDCYSYAYDAATYTYYYVGDVSDTPAGTTTIGDVTINVGYPIQPTPIPSAEAYEALVLFANDQLGAVVEPLYAGAATDGVQSVLTYLPEEIEALMLNATSISGAAYWGLLPGGAAAVAVGDCAVNCAITADNLSVQLSSGSAGAYGMLASAAAPTSPDTALQLITTVYPKLEGLAFAQITDVETGYAFTATTASVGYDAATQQPVSSAKVVYAGVVDVNGVPFVYALVAIGQGYVDLLG